MSSQILAWAGTRASSFPIIPNSPAAGAADAVAVAVDLVVSASWSAPPTYTPPDAAVLMLLPKLLLPLLAGLGPHVGCRAWMLYNLGLRRALRRWRRIMLGEPAVV